jgi:hypothetical protein
MGIQAIYLSGLYQACELSLVLGLEASDMSDSPEVRSENISRSSLS